MSKFLIPNVHEHFERVECFPIPGLSPDYCGTLPFSFLSWAAYSVYLVCKIGVIFSSQIPAFMTDFEGTQSREGE